MGNAPLTSQIRLYHITHIDNLPSILEATQLLSDAQMINSGASNAAIGMGEIKQRRLKLPVSCHAGCNVGEFVPFYFCPRSVMLFLIHCANHPNLAYKGGQEPILHLEVKLADVMQFAQAKQVRWAFSTANAGAKYTEFYNAVAMLSKIDWNAVHATDFRSPDIKEHKQAEFLLYQTFPWSLVNRIGVKSRGVFEKVNLILEQTQHRPQVAIMPNWYY
jgi:ssDNA thymidine ADP-ribosyltransferase, DarT